MDLKKLLKITPETLAKEQHDALRDACIDRLESIIKLLRSGEYDKVNGMLGFSPAGDGHGTDNHYIDFEDLLPDADQNGVDISTVLSKLKRLEGIIVNAQKK